MGGRDGFDGLFGCTALSLPSFKSELAIIGCINGAAVHSVLIERPNAEINQCRLLARLVHGDIRQQ